MKHDPNAVAKLQKRAKASADRAKADLRSWGAKSITESDDGKTLFVDGAVAWTCTWEFEADGPHFRECFHGWPKAD